MKMINSYVLDRDYLDVFLDCILEYTASSSQEIDSLIEGCTYYTSSIHSNNYFFSKNIQRKIIKKIYPDDYLNKVYSLQSDKLFSLEELNKQFMDFLISHTSKLEIDLDTHLKEIQEDFINSNYGKQVRY